MTIVPAATCLLQGSTNRSDAKVPGLSISWLSRLYEFSLTLVFRRPVLGVVLGAILPVIGLQCIRELPVEFFPPADRAQIQIEVEQAAHSSLDATQESVRQIETTVATNQAVLGQSWFVGRSAPTFYYNVVPRRRNTSFYAQAFVDLKPGTDARTTVRELQTMLDQSLPSSRILVRQLAQGPPFDAPVEVCEFLAPTPRHCRSSAGNSELCWRKLRP